MATHAYHVGENPFSPEEILPKRLFEAITVVQVDRPEIILTEARKRRKRQRLTEDGKLVILATDHPGRRVTELGADSLVMDDRHSYLARALRVLATP